MIQRRWPPLSLVCMVTGICLVAWITYSYIASSPCLVPALEAAVTDIEVSGCAAAQIREVVLRLENRSSQPIRVLGLAGC
jgi:hypothetical protein